MISVFMPRRLLAVGVLCLSFLAQSSEKAPLEESDLIGKWALKCDGSGWISIANRANITMEVNVNQIYIHATGKISGKNLIIKLIEPTDLGVGGMSLAWDSFSKTMPIAEMQIISDKSAKIEWLGFYNEKSNSREWANEPDFFDPENHTLKKCSFPLPKEGLK